MKKFLVGCLVVFAGLFGVLILVIYFTPQEEKDQAAKDRVNRLQAEKDTAAWLVTKVVDRMKVVRSKLPTLTATSASKKCPFMDSTAVQYLYTSVKEMNQYQENGFVRDSTLYSDGPPHSRILQIIYDNYGKSVSPEEWDRAEVSIAARRILAFKYLGVYVPLVYEAPKIVDDKKFDSGYFDGWIILVEASTGKPLGHIRFEAFSSEKIENSRIKVGVGPLSVPITGEGIDQKMREDFRDRFFEASDAAVKDMVRPL